MIEVTLKVNGEEHQMKVMPYETLCDVLRNRLGHTEVKFAIG